MRTVGRLRFVGRLPLLKGPVWVEADSDGLNERLVRMVGEHWGGHPAVEFRGGRLWRSSMSVTSA